MAGHRPWREISAKNRSDPERNARVAAGVRIMLFISALTELRESRGLTETELASALGMSPAHLSQLIHHGDLDISMLDEYVRAMGGKLRISVVFPDETVELVGPELARAGA